jgi:DNA-binding CsgD family transcriptional regulator/tetratricopeptide (TPR) repeat protein
LLVLDIEGAQASLSQLPDRAAGWEPGLEIAVAAMRPLPAYGAGAVAEALDHIDRAIALIDRAPDEHLTDFMDALAWLCWGEILLYRYDDAMRHLNRITEITRGTGRGYILGYILAGRARLLAMRGRPEEAESVAEEAAEMGQLMRSDEVVSYALTQQCLAVSHSGDHDRAVRLGNDAVKHAVGVQEWWAGVAAYTRGLALLAAGRLEEGAAVIRGIWDSGAALRLDPGTQVACAERMAYAEAALGRSEEAHRWAGLTESMASPLLGVEVAFARLGRAHALRLNDPGAAAGLAAEAAGLFTAGGRAPEAGQAELTAGLAHSEAGERSLARTRLQAASDIFEHCSMRGLHAQVVREQRRLGVYVPGKASQSRNTHGLSRRELDVVALILEGDSNLRIAEKLFISVRTVETHVSHIFAKLGVSSRLGVAKAMAGSQDRPGL